MENRGQVKISGLSKRAFLDKVYEDINNSDSQKQKNIDELIAYLHNSVCLNKYSSELSGEELSSDKKFLLFLLCLDVISTKLYHKSEEGDLTPLVVKDKYSNKDNNGYFDRLFEIASKLIYLMIDKDNWNVILKMDVHNSSKGPSVYSLVMKDDKGDVKYCSKEQEGNSKAYSLFFFYREYCSILLKDKEIRREEDVYTVHREFADSKIARSFAYEYKDNKLLRYNDGRAESEEAGANENERGKQAYLDFLKCVLDIDFYKKADSSDFARRYNECKNRKDWKKENTAKSFTFLNLGISGFESWGTLMIEALGSDDESSYTVEEVGDFFYHSKESLQTKREEYVEEEEREDSKVLGMIKNIISALKKVDDEYNESLNKERIKKESIKSAVSAIMSRNMSHNLGSHYMYYTKAHMEKMAAKAGNMGPDIRGAAKVLGYVQARMDYLATVISNDKYPYGAVNFKSQIYDELTIDDFSHRHFPIWEKDYLLNKNKRTTNFLLTNLIYSENYTRPDVRCDEIIDTANDKLYLHVKYSSNGNEFEKFTGSWLSAKLSNIRNEIKQKNLPTINKEQKTKNALSSLNIALPGGSMSCHAFFNVVENFIRNSAKYSIEDAKPEGLICTIAIKPNTEEKHKDGYVDIIVYDNKENANKVIASNGNHSLYDVILEKLSTLIIVDEQNKISKDNKGFKEMLFSSIWMRAYTFGRKSYADIVSEINQGKVGEDKLKLIEYHGFSLVKVVDDNGGGISVFKRTDSYEGRCNLGIMFTLPKYNQIEQFGLSDNRSNSINAMLNTMADIVEVDNDFVKSESEFKFVFTRPLVINDVKEMTSVDKYKAVIEKRFPQIDSYSLSFGDNDAAESSFEKTTNNYRIYFHRHLSTQKNLQDFEDYAYADSVSGGNFTITMFDLFRNGIENGRYKTIEDQIFALKIKESALTRVTIIDERLYNSTLEKEYPWMALKNVRILNYCDTKIDSKDNSLSPIFVGSNFKDKSNKTHFLSIHLGLIEKILKNSDYVNELIDIKMKERAFNDDKLTISDKRVLVFMELLKDHFCGKNDKCEDDKNVVNNSDEEDIRNHVYIAIHSGRGNYSAELEGPLSTYPFISLSALENAYNNSKYQLSQLLYNTVYVGKGLANESNNEI